MEVRFGAADLLLQARRGSPPLSPQLRLRHGPRDRRPSPRRLRQGNDSVEQSDSRESTQSVEESPKAPQGREEEGHRHRHREEPVAETGHKAEITGRPEKSQGSRPVGPRLPEDSLPEPSRRNHRLHFGPSDANSSHDRSRRALSRFASEPDRSERQRRELTKT